jgi:hypothetical protein
LSETTSFGSGGGEEETMFLFLYMFNKEHSSSHVGMVTHKYHVFVVFSLKMGEKDFALVPSRFYSTKSSYNGNKSKQKIK